MTVVGAFDRKQILVQLRIGNSVARYLLKLVAGWVRPSSTKIAHA